MEPNAADLIPLTTEEAISDLMIALAVIKPRIQIGRGKKLPDESERDRRFAAELIVRYYQRCGIRLFRKRDPAPIGTGTAHFLHPEKPTKDTPPSPR